MIKVAASHVDHVPAQILIWVLEKYADRTAFFIDTTKLPEDLPALEDALHGPSVGDAPVPETEVRYAPRGTRPYDSRVVDRPVRPTRTVTVIGGPHEGEPCVLYTVFGGAPTPKEVMDPYLKPEEAAASEAFWREHALAG